MKPVDIKDEKYQYGVIDPKGNFYPCHYEGHNYLAQKLQSEGIIPADADSYSFFEENGWLMLTGAMLTDCEFTFNFNPEISVYGDKGLEYNRVKRNLTKEQVQAIYDHKKARKEDTLNFNFKEMTIKEFEKMAEDNFSYYND